MLHAPRHAILESLSNRIGETCNFGVMVGSNAVYLDRIELAWPLGLRFESGSRVPLHCTAMGKLFLSLLPSRKRALLLRTLPLHPYTESTITDPVQLERELDNVRSSRISTDHRRNPGRRRLRGRSGQRSECAAGRGAGDLGAAGAHDARTGVAPRAPAAGRRRAAFRNDRGRRQRQQALGNNEEGVWG